MRTARAHRPGPSVDEAPGWLAVEADRACPVCGATDGCGVAPADGLALCRTTVSPLPVTGGGWLHDVGGARACSSAA